MVQEVDASGGVSPGPAPGPLLTREVFVDTEVYRRTGFDAAKPSIQALLKQVFDDRLQLHLTDITLSEIQRQITDDAHAGMEEIRRASLTAAKWRKKAPGSVSIPKAAKPIDPAAVGAEAYAQFRNSLQPFVNHAASRHEATTIFDAYFGRRAPFDAHGGKSTKEFPDAFVIAALDEWCLENSTFMYVVTGDQAMRRAAEDCERLIPVETLESLLETATIQHSPDVIDAVEALLEQPVFEDQLALALDQSIDYLSLDYVGELYEGEASEPKRSGIPEIHNWTVISAHDGAYGLIIEFDVEIISQLSYYDTTTASYDKEDGIFGAIPASAEIEDVVRLRMFVQVHEDFTLSRSELITTSALSYGMEEDYR